MSDEQVNILGLEGNMTLVQAIAPVANQDVTPILSSAIDTRDYPGKRILVIFENKETTDTAYTTAVTVTESATSGGSYTASTTSGTLTSAAASGTLFATVKRNTAKPFIKVTFTGSHADLDVISAASVLFF